MEKKNKYNLKHKKGYLNPIKRDYKINKKYIIIAIIIIVIIIVALTIKKLNENNKLNMFEKVIKDSSTAVCDVLKTPIYYIYEQIRINDEKNNIYEKYKKLRDKEAKLESYEAKIGELEDEINVLKSTLAINNVLSDYTPIVANVSNRDVGYWYNVITIDKGSKSGISKNDAVIVSNGLIGKILNVSKYHSTVKLLTTEELGNKVSVKIKSSDSDLYGLLSSYDKKTNTYTIEGIDDNGDIEIGSQVTTTGLSQVFPSGILIGTVNKVTNDEYDLTKIVKVTPSVNFSDITIVSVLKRGVK